MDIGSHLDVVISAVKDSKTDLRDVAIITMGIYVVSHAELFPEQHRTYLYTIIILSIGFGFASLMLRSIRSHRKQP